MDALFTYFATHFTVAAVAKIFFVNLILSGDNAVVIALACRNLNPHHQKWGMIWGIAGAIILRVILTAFAVTLLELQWLKLIGGILLFWIGIKLMIPGNEEKEVHADDHLFNAVKTIIIADLVMSIDNVVAVAGAANGNTPLIVFGLILSIPIIVGASSILMKLMEKFPIIITLGAAVIGHVAGEMAVTEPVVRPYLAKVFNEHTIEYLAWVGVIFVVGVGMLLAKKKAKPVSGAIGA